MIRRELNPSPPPAPGPPAQWNDEGTRRIRIEVIQRVHIDVDVTAGTSADDQDEQVVRRLAEDLLDGYRRDPNGWERQFARCFPEVIGRPKVSLGEIVDVGPGVQQPERPEPPSRAAMEYLERQNPELAARVESVVTGDGRFVELIQPTDEPF